MGQNLRDWANTDAGLLHFKRLARQLPEDGVAIAFPNETSCRVRLAEVRWPGGPVCPVCSAHKIGHITRGDLYRCNECSKAFSAISGTILHKTSVGLRTCFLIAERILTDPPGYHLRVTLNSIVSEFSISKTSALKFRSLITNDIWSNPPGLITRSVCTGVL